MKSKTRGFVWHVLFTAVLSAFGVGQTATAQTGLKVTYGNKGVQTIAYRGITLADVGVYGADAFHIWHMKSTDLNGNLLTNGGYGWGESNYGENWNAQTSTETYTFSWGTISTKFVQNGDNLDMTVTETNNSGSGIIFDGAEIYPIALHFPQDPLSFYGYNQFSITTRGPGVSVADFGTGVITSVIPNEAVAMYGGWKSAGNNTYSPIMAATAPDGLPSFLPKSDQPVLPGNSLTYIVSLRFTPEGTAANASDAYASFAATYPSQMTWTDKRIIGTAYLASSPSNSDITQPGGFPTNPRRYFNDPSVDITTAAGLRAFQNRMLTQAKTNVSTAQALKGQGIITWDIEGEQYPQPTSYVCSPDQIAAVSPEMESIVTDPLSQYYGQRLDDAYFKTMSNAGLKIGLCLRPQAFKLAGNGTASQNYLGTNASIIANLEAKARYANARWGATIFYVDSTVDTVGGTLDPAVFQQLITDVPSFLFIPEESTPRYYAYSAPFYSFLATSSLGTPASTYNFYPNAFGANMVNDASAATLATYTPQLTKSVKNGDILMGHADYWQENDPTLVSIYEAAGVKSVAPQVTPVIAWSTPSAISYGTPLSGAILNATASVPGDFVYAPAVGTVLDAGVNTLLLTFTPSDLVNYKAATSINPLTVAQALPVVQWTTPPSVVSGTPLSGGQLNASANIPGSFSYVPGAGTILPLGNNTLHASFTPADAKNYASASASTNLSVTQVVPVGPVLTWPVPAAVPYGTALSGAQLNASANVPGNFLYSPSAGSVLNAGSTTLSVTFTPVDTINYKTVTITNYVVVTKVTPTIQWTTPSPIVYGTALSSAQLNASANVPGNFSYTPGQGAVLPVGSNAIGLTFTPADATDYTTAAASTSVTVTQAVQVTPTLNWQAPSTISYGTALSGTQLNASASVPGTFAYTPAAGSVLNAGAATLSVVFTPTDKTSYKSATASTKLTVSQASPVLNWPAPSAINYGTALSAIQLNASSNIPGSFTYTPAVGAIFAVGNNVLNATFTPVDKTNYTSGSISTTVNVIQQAQVSPPITWAAPASITYGSALSGMQLNASSTVPGTFVYAPAAGYVPGAGTTLLQVTFTPSNTIAYKTVSIAINLSVVKATPNVSWAVPAPVAPGTTLSATQLNATANVPGTFLYRPPFGTVVNASTVLRVSFTPADTANYNPQSASVTLALSMTPPANTHLAILSPTDGQTVTGTISVVGYVNLYLDSAGSYLMVDGRAVGDRRVTSPPYSYPLDTTTLSNGAHILQLWAHDIGNNVTVSAPVTLNVAN